MRMENLINKRVFYIVVAILLMFFTKQDSMILNITFEINVTTYLCSLFISLVYFYIYDKQEIIGRIISIITTSFFIYLLLKLVLIFGIKEMASNQKIEAQYPIENYIANSI